MLWAAESMDGRNSIQKSSLWPAMILSHPFLFLVLKKEKKRERKKAFPFQAMQRNVKTSLLPVAGIVGHAPNILPTYQSFLL